METKEERHKYWLESDMNFCPDCGERLRDVGCVAADCSAGRGADKEECDAERAKPSIAALIPPEEAEDMVKKLIDDYSESARECAEDAEKYRDNDDVLTTHHDTADLLYQKVIQDLERILSESRKANAAEPLERGTPINAQTLRDSNNRES